MFEFGSGTLWGFPVGGNTATNPTPMKFGTLQDVSLDISGDVKQLYGQKQFPEAVARGKCKITGKSKFAAINGKMLNDLFFGQTMGAGMIKTSLDEAAPIPATPFQITGVATPATSSRTGAFAIRQPDCLSPALPPALRRTVFGEHQHGRLYVRLRR